MIERGNSKRSIFGLFKKFQIFSKPLVPASGLFGVGFS